MQEQNPTVPQPGPPERRPGLQLSVGWGAAGEGTGCCHTTSVTSISSLKHQRKVKPTYRIQLSAGRLPQVRRFSEAFFYTEHEKLAVLTFQENL